MVRLITLSNDNNTVKEISLSMVQDANNWRLKDFCRITSATTSYSELRSQVLLTSLSVSGVWRNLQRICSGLARPVDEINITDIICLLYLIFDIVLLDDVGHFGFHVLSSYSLISSHYFSFLCCFIIFMVRQSRFVSFHF